MLVLHLKYELKSSLRLSLVISEIMVANYFLRALRKSVSILMLFAVFLQLIWGSGYLVDYYVNTDYYKSLCVNKERPELNCDGKCILAQKIKKQSDNKDSNPQTIRPISSEYLWNVMAIAFTKQTDIEDPQETRYRNQYAHLFMWDIFKPPV